MSARTFLDTNVLFYADDVHNPAKQQRAEVLIKQLLRAETGCVSLQVLQEYFNNATRKLGIGAGFARMKVERYMRFEIVKLEPNDLLAAIDLHREHQFSIWDALIIRAALISHCDTLYSEDMLDGRRIDGLTIVNPF